MTGDTRDPGRIRLCSASRASDADGPDLREEAENLSQWMVFLGEQAQDIPRLVRASGVMRDLIAENKRLRLLAADLLAALELLLPYATPAPAWAIQAARDAIEQARGGAK